MKVLIIFGTRPEAIKMAPIIKEISRRKQFGDIDMKIALTGQHKEMLRQVMDVFDIKEDVNLDIFKSGQSLTEITAKSLTGLEGVIKDFCPDVVLVQGDTTAVLAGALAAFYQKVDVAHVEAGLRSFDRYSPFPEEMNRRLTGVLAALHFAPTETNAQNLRSEGISDKDIFVTGNTVIDALSLSVKKDYRFSNAILNDLDFEKEKVILLTCHRRESIGKPMENIFSAMRDALEENKNMKIVFPMHKNPKVRELAKKHFINSERVLLIEPLDYEPFVNLMAKVHFIVSDSGGVQEEAPSLGKPVLVVRNDTERPEGVDAGTAKLCGTEYQDVYDSVSKLLNDAKEYEKMAKAVNPYGDGNASKRIVDILESRYK